MKKQHTAKQLKHLGGGFRTIRTRRKKSKYPSYKDLWDELEREPLPGT